MNVNLACFERKRLLACIIDGNARIVLRFGTAVAHFVSVDVQRVVAAVDRAVDVERRRVAENNIGVARKRYVDRVINRTERDVVVNVIVAAPRSAHTERHGIARHFLIGRNERAVCPCVILIRNGDFDRRAFEDHVEETIVVAFFLFNQSVRHIVSFAAPNIGAVDFYVFADRDAAAVSRRHDCGNKIAVPV